jgi:alpha-tubulin suppressor-like RCC1 family protein
MGGGHYPDWTVMNATIARIIAIGSLALLQACGGGGGGPTVTTPAAPTLLSVAIGDTSKAPLLPGQTLTLSLGTSKQLYAFGTYSDGTTSPIPTTTLVKWTLAGTAVAFIYDAGLVKGLSIGSETVSIESGGRSGSIKLAVNGPYAAVTAGGSHTVAGKADGTLSAWGLNRSGQLGDGTTIDKAVATPVYGSGTTWSTVAGGDLHTIALKDVKVPTTGGALWAWGFNQNGQLGNGSLIDKTIPTQVGSAKDWISVATGKAHSVAVNAKGQLWAWGRNVDGQVGDGSTTDRSIPTLVASVATPWTAVSAGSNFSIGRQASGKIYGWGSNDLGQLGFDNGVTTGVPKTSVPVLINFYSDDGGLTALGSFNALAVSAGGSHVLALRSNGALYSWGANDFGQLGLGFASLFRSFPGPVPSPNAAVGWDKFSAGGAHSVAIMTDGTLWAWGSNSDGQLGDDSTASSDVPIQIGDAKNWVFVSAGKAHTFAIKSDGSLWGWGRNVEGQLGAISKNENVLKPTMYP